MTDVLRLMPSKQATMLLARDLGPLLGPGDLL
jgi:hypothetical protein